MSRPTDDELEAMAKYHDWREGGDSYTADMLRAFKGQPAPDHSEWNTAIEAAAKVAERRSTDGLSDDDPYNEGWRRCATITTAAIRNLKKGPDQ